MLSEIEVNMNTAITTIIAELAVKALLYEVSASPKPGLVDRFNNGAHKDMDFYTFIDSSISLGTYFFEISKCVDTLYESTFRQGHFIDSNLFFKSLQKIGMDAELKMFKETDNVNTHKGAIYALGLITSAATEYWCAFGDDIPDRNVYIETIANRVGDYTRPVIIDQLSSIGGAKTYGEAQYKTLGLTGARGEAATGYANARTWGVPALDKAISEGYSLNDAMVQALLILMCHLEDSNVIGRHDYETLLLSKEKANSVLELGGIYSQEGRDAIQAYDLWCIEKNISHGGSADLLAVSVFLKLLADKFCNPL